MYQMNSRTLCSRGIQQKLIAPHNPQQNGMAKSKNKSTVGAARVMLHDQGLSLHLWAEACNIVIYVHNISPHRTLGMSTPEETFSSKKRDVYTSTYLVHESTVMLSSMHKK